MTANNLLDHSEVHRSKNETICNVHKGNKIFQSLLILCERQLKESNKYKLIEKCRNNLETFTDELFVVEDIIFSKIQGTMLIQVRTYDKIILFVYNMKLLNIQETVTVFQNESGTIKHQPRPTKDFFVNHTDYDDGLIVAASGLCKQIKVFSRTLKTGYRLLFCVSFNFIVTGSSDYKLHCMSNRYNQILFFLAGRNGIVVYDLFDISNKTIFGLNELGYEDSPELCFNESGEELYIRYDDKICVYLCKSMFKSLVSLSASVVAQTYAKPHLIEMRLLQHVYKYLNLFW